MNLKMKAPSIEVPNFIKSIRYMLSIINVLFLLTGIILLITGAVILSIYKEYDGFVTRTFFAIPSFVIATGVIMIIASALGFYGAFSESFYCIAAYAIIHLVILVFEISMVIVAFALVGNATSEIQDTMWTSLRLYGSRIEISMQWDNLQRSYECCGVNGPFNFIPNGIPISCCYIDFGVVGTFNCTSINAHILGCATALGDWLGYNAHVVAITSLVATCLQIPITAVAFYMAYRSKFHVVELES